MKMRILLRLLPFVMLFAACSPKGPYVLSNKVYHRQVDSIKKIITVRDPLVLKDSAGIDITSEFIGTVNFNIRKPNYVIIHFTAQDSVVQTLKTFVRAKTQVSAHYVISRDGKVYHMLNDYLRAWHAGVSKWGSISDMNSCSIGIELDNNGSEPFAKEQINSLLILLARLKKLYNIPTTNFIGHQDIAPGRKPDPGPYFPWQVLAQHGFGYWSDDVLEVPPDSFDPAIALRLMGYDTHDINAAIVAFKRHFVQIDNSPQLTQLDLNVLYNVYKKYSD